MTYYDSTTIDNLYNHNLSLAIQSLLKLDVFCGQSPKISGLNGWVFEQTIQFCLRKELEAIGIQTAFYEQHQLEGKVKVDLLVKHLAIEIKSRGIFGKSEASKYLEYRITAQQLGLKYLYLTRSENYAPYRIAMIEAIGHDDTFFLDRQDDWDRFVMRVAKELNEN